jgi:alkanesulfonate monooxygenase SsuD/methylene tetrahydromethanopterin reductase-like flavin-dependent oxidoreductase (luciferase family)
MSYADTLEAAEAGALYGTPDEIAARVQALRDVGAEYVLLNSAGGPETLRRFAREIRPRFVTNVGAPTWPPTPPSVRHAPEV